MSEEQTEVGVAEPVCSFNDPVEGFGLPVWGLVLMAFVIGLVLGG